MFANHNLLENKIYILCMQKVRKTETNSYFDPLHFPLIGLFSMACSVLTPSHAQTVEAFCGKQRELEHVTFAVRLF